MANAIEAEAVRKRFGPIEVLRGLELAVPAGITYGLLGPSGSGKTTLIRILLGLTRADGGAATVLGRRMPDRRVLGEVGYMPQSPALYPDLTARENVAFFARVQGVADGGRIMEALDLVQLAERAGSPVHTFSGGMLQRTSLACALVHRPRLLFLDEPTVGMDPILRRRFWEYFRTLNGRGGHDRPHQPHDGGGTTGRPAGAAPRGDVPGRRHAGRRLPGGGRLRPPGGLPEAGGGAG